MLRKAFFLNVLDYARCIAELVPFAVDDTKAFVRVELPDLLERLVAELVKDAAQIKAPECLRPHLLRAYLLGACHQRFAIRRLALRQHSRATSPLALPSDCRAAMPRVLPLRWRAGVYPPRH